MVGGGEVKGKINSQRRRAYEVRARPESQFSAAFQLLFSVKIEAMMFQFPIELTISDDRGERQQPYDGEHLVLGRAEDCDVVLTTNKSSRYHAEVLSEAGHLTLIDRGSANGTYVNGERVERRSLRPGDEVTIGASRIRFGRVVIAEASTPHAPLAGTPTTGGSDASAAPAKAGAAATPAQPAAVPAAALRTVVDAAPVARSRTVISYTTAPAVTAITLGIPTALIIVMVLLVYTQLERKGPFAPSSSGPAVVDGPSSGGASGDPNAALFGVDDLESLQEYEQLEQRASSGSVGWEIVNDAAMLIEQYPKTRGAERARKLRGVLESVRRVVVDADVARAEEQLAVLLADGSYGAVITVCRFLARTDGVDRAYWAGRAEEIDRRARSEFLEIEQDLSELISAAQPGEALRRVVDLRAEYGGTAVFEEILPRYLDAGLASVAAVGREADGEAIERTLQRVAKAMEECRYRDLESLYYRVLSLGPTTETRVRAYEGLVDAIYLQRMFVDFVSKVSEEPVDSKLGRIVRATDEEVQFEREVEGHTFVEAKRWRRIPAATKLALFEAVVFSRDGLLGVALLAARSGDLQAEQQALVRLHKRAGGKEIAAALVARRRGVPVPESGFVVYRERLVTPAEKAADIAERKASREHERALARELSEKKRSDKLDRYLDIALQLRAEGKFELAHRVLTEVSSKGSGEVQARAIAMADDPLLASHELRMSGPASNRLDFFILGEGYPIVDDYQEAFLTQARVCMNLLLNEEPFREYQEYLNFQAVQLGSKEPGVDKIPGEVVVDSPLDGKVEWDVFTVNRGKVMEILGRLGESGRDQQAIVIGNCDAGVATGGGGVACMARGNYIPAGHEVGHSLAGLHDEYDTEPGTRPGRTAPKRKPNVPTAQLPPNLMSGSNRITVLERVVWKKWIDAGPDRWWNGSKVEVFEGGNRQPFNIWRPQASCKMRSAGSRFCVVCMEVMILELYKRVRPIDRVEPENPEVVLASGEKLHFKVLPMQPQTHPLEVTWHLKDLGLNKPSTEPKEGSTRVNDESHGELFKRTLKLQDPNGRWVHAAELSGRKLRPGWHRLRCIVHDPTEWVLTDREGLLTQIHDWFIEVKE